MPSIVICDDHRLFSEAVSLVLVGRGHCVMACTTDPVHGVAAVRRHTPDLYLTDVRFPRGDGIDSMAHALAASPSTRAVVLTGLTDQAVRNRARRAGASGFVTKDGSMDRILAAIDTVAAGGIFFDDAPPPAVALAGGPRRDERLRFLTAREREVLDRMVRGESTASMAAAMGIAYPTARTHIQNVLTKLGVHSKLEAVALAVDMRARPDEAPLAGQG
ncbi:MAG: response regulator transcription factor [Actinomycetota bacterium]|nr:response regulator transcription factor [Actinomycetota bacterium]